MHDDLFRHPHRHDVNVQVVCPDCAASWLGHFTDVAPQSLVGALVKRGFPVPDPPQGPSRFSTEHMWVKVTRVREGGTLEGRLANDPRYIPQLRYGALVTCTLDQIEAVEYPQR
jgi:hypothetical protein